MLKLFSQDSPIKKQWYTIDLKVSGIKGKIDWPQIKYRGNVDKQLTDVVFPSTKIQHAMCPHTFYLYQKVTTGNTLWENLPRSLNSI